MARLYEIAARIGEECLDGRSNHGAWGLESQFHATRESAEAAVARLRGGGDKTVVFLHGLFGTPEH